MNIKTYNSQQSLQIITEAMERGPRAFFTRYGDNDLMMLSGTNMNGVPLTEKADKTYGGNKTRFSQALMKDIRESFLIEDPDYLLAASCTWDIEPGMEPGVFAPFKYNRKLAIKLSELTDQREFLLPVVFHYLCLFNIPVFKKWVNKYIRPKRVLYIGSVPQRYVEMMLGPIQGHVRTPKRTAYELRDSWMPRAMDEATSGKYDVVIPSIGQCTRVIQGKLWKQGAEIHSLDMGSMFDALCDRGTRTWIREKGWVVRKNYTYPN